MGEALNERGQRVAEAFGATKREVFDKLENLAPDAKEYRIKNIEERMAGQDASFGKTATASAAGSREMPRYKCFKEVHALKIAAIETRRDETEGRTRWFLTFEDPFDSVEVTETWIIEKHAQDGGYLVVYADGYKSYSPAKAFEEGYTRVEG